MGRIASPSPVITSAISPSCSAPQRTGVDLSQEGGEHPDDWHIAHFVNPRYTRPSSIMPPFEWLGKDTIDTLTHYVQSLGLKDADQRMERQRYWKAEGHQGLRSRAGCQCQLAGEDGPRGLARHAQSLSDHRPACSAGTKSTRNFCIGCHGPIGDGMGPAQPWIYPPPLNFTILKGREISGGIIYYQIMNGITGTAMPYFKRELESQKIWEVGNYVAVYFINQSDANTEPRGIDAAWEP